VCENNAYAYSTPTHLQTRAARLADKAVGYGIPGVTADGNDVLATYDATREAVARARAGEGPTLVELVTYRRRGHAEHDNQSYVPPGEIESWAARDPIDRFRRRLLDEGWGAPDEVAGVDARVDAELDGALATCLDEPLPDPSTALSGVCRPSSGSARGTGVSVRRSVPEPLESSASSPTSGHPPGHLGGDGARSGRVSPR
jgi:pyruvate dehydrogenase E1 component alpha subunit/2-oxoisovalerate dehydrogenase E1 component alpha subunit